MKTKPPKRKPIEVSYLTSWQWFVLNNVRFGRDHSNDIADRESADLALASLIENGMIVDGKLTPSGESALTKPFVSMCGKLVKT